MHKIAPILVLGTIALAVTGCHKSQSAHEAAPQSTVAALPSSTTAKPKPPGAQVAGTLGAEAGAGAAAATPSPGDYAVTTLQGRQLGKLTIEPDGTYRDVPKHGTPITGSVKIAGGGRMCFDPSGKTAPTCWTNGRRAVDRSFVSTSDKGNAVKLLPLAK